VSDSLHPLEAARAAGARLREWLGGSPAVAVVLGSGWATVAEALGPAELERPAAELLGAAAPTAPGHAGLLRASRVGPDVVVALSGRLHLYEGHGAAAVVHAVRALVLAGARTVVLTNAAGALRPELEVGRPVVIADHLNLTGTSPLTGELPPHPFPCRFVDLGRLYDPALRALVRGIDPSLDEGVYAAVAGPQFETPAEVVMLRRLGADLVGMSTALEAIAAHHLGARVLGLSLVTNLACGLTPDGVDADEVLAVGRDAAGSLGPLLAAVLRAIAVTGEPAGPSSRP